MKYYFNFIGVPSELNDVKNPSYRFPTDPQYKQDGVYNQKCKYRLTNIQLTNATQGELAQINGKTLVIRFNNLTSMNVFNLTAKQDATGYKQLGERPVEFHIRVPDNKMEQSTKTGDIVQDLVIDPFNIFTPAHDIANNNSGTATIKAVTSDVDGGTGADITGTLTKSGDASNSFLLNGLSENSFTEEIIGSSCWGLVPDISFSYYETNEAQTFFKDDALLDDVAINFSLEVEPVAVKL